MIVVIILLIGAGWLFIHSMSTQGIPCSPPPPPTPQIGTMAQAIAEAEGSDPDWNNPGDLTLSFGYPTAGVANSAGVLKFVNCADGWNALYKQLSAIVNGGSRYSLNDTIASFGMGYSGGDPNWAKNVAANLGVSPDTPLSEVLA